VTGEDEVDHLSLADLMQIADGILTEVVVRDVGLLASAAAGPATTAFGTDAYPSFVAKAAALMHSLARNHALVDGNKRLAWSATRAFCLINGRDIRYSIDDAEDFVVSVAAGDLGVPEISSWVTDHLIG
jgi:death on curing protein